jgi:hypothetical protein
MRKNDALGCAGRNGRLTRFVICDVSTLQFWPSDFYWYAQQPARVAVQKKGFLTLEDQRVDTSKRLTHLNQRSYSTVSQQDPPRLANLPPIIHAMIRPLSTFVDHYPNHSTSTHGERHIKQIKRTKLQSVLVCTRSTIQ